MLIILRYFFGYLKVEVKGFAPERFMNLIIKNDVVIWDVDSTDGGYIFFTGRKNLLKMKPLLQKTNVKLKILEKRGLPYTIKENKKRLIFLIGFLICIVGIYILSLFIWEVKVTGENRLVAKSILKKIESDYVPLGSLKSHVDCGKLERDLRKSYPEISWISCGIKGTTLSIKLEEGLLPAKQETNLETGDIVAKKDAYITKMITREGTPVAKVKDKVKKGDILISGTIYIYDDNHEVLETNYIVADGDIYGETIENYEDKLEIKYYEKKYAEKTNKYLSFFFLDYCITPIKGKIKHSQYDTTVEIHKFKIFSDFYLPLGYKVTEVKPYQLVQKEYTQKEAEERIQKRLKEKINELKEKGVEIVENNVKIKKQDGKMVAVGTLLLKEPIGVIRELTVVPPEEANSY